MDPAADNSLPLTPPSVDPADAFAKFNSQTTLWTPDNARAMLYASALAYADTEDRILTAAQSWGFPANRVKVITPSSSVLQAVVLGNDSAVVLAFRGTRPEELRDWMSDFEIVQTPFSKYFSAPNVGAVHDGFARLLATGWSAIQAEVLTRQDHAQSLWITGHSLGGALAVLATAAFTFAARRPVNGLYTFGQPRVGGIEFCTQCDSHFGDCMFRFVNDGDIVTRVPPRVVPGVPLPEFYGHSGQLRFFDAGGALHQDGHMWNAFLLRVEVGFAKMKALLSAPVADHALIAGYGAKLEAYIESGSPPLT